MTSQDPFAASSADSSQSQQQFTPQEFTPQAFAPQDQAGSGEQSGGYAQPAASASSVPAPPSQGYASAGYAAPSEARQTYQGSGYGTPGGSTFGAPAASSYPAQSYASAPVPSGGTDGVSIAALVVGLLGGGFIAIILGALGIKRTADGSRSGAGLAWTGIVLGIVGTIAATALVVWPIAAAAVVFDADTWDFEDTTGTVTSGAETYGDDPVLDALWDQCEAGDGAACDDLYWDSPLGSDYEEFGDTCAGRGRPVGQVWCDPNS